MAKVILTLLVLTFFVNGCVTYKQCVDKFGYLSRDTVRITVRDTVRIVHVLPGDSLETEINIDSLCARVASSKLQMEDSLQRNRLTLRWWVDRYNRLLKVRAVQKADTVTITKIVEVQGECPPQVVLDPAKSLPWHSRLWNSFQTFSAWVVVAGLAILLFYLLFKR